MEKLKSINKLTQLTAKVSAGKKILSVYFIAGYPSLEDTAEIVLSLQDFGVDAIEVGMPYADPLVDGSVIQNSGYQALSNGMNIDILFEQLSQIKDRVHIPWVLMGYYNQMFRYGVEKFIRRAHYAGCSGILFPDLPLKEYIDEVKPHTDIMGINNIQLITPRTESTIRHNILQYAQGFLYVVSNPMTTGGNADFSAYKTYFQEVSDTDIGIPKLVGFGIDSREKLDFVYRYFDGAIIGTSFITSLRQGAIRQSVADFFEQRLRLHISQG